MAYINQTEVEVFAVSRGGPGGMITYVPPEMTAGATAGGGGGGEVQHFFITVPETPGGSTLLASEVNASSQFSVGLPTGYFTSYLQAAGEGGSLAYNFSTKGSPGGAGAAGGGAVGTGEADPYTWDPSSAGSFWFSGANAWAGGKGSTGGNGGEGRTLYGTDGTVIGLRAGGGAGAAGSGSFSPETDRGNGGPGVVFAPDFKDVHEYWREDLNYLPTEHRHVITGVYAAGGASGAPGSFGGAGGGADAPSSDGHGITAHAPGCGGSGACKLSNSDSGIYMHGHGGDGVVIVRYAGPPKAEIRHPYGAYQEGNNVKNYTYYRAGYTYHVLAGAANLLWFGGTSATVGLLSPDGLNPVSVADENGVLNYKAYATGTAPKYNYGIWHNCLWQSSNAAQFALASGDATFKELAPKYFIHTGVNGEGDERRYSSDVLGSFFNVGFVIPSAQADDAAVVTRIALYGHVSSGAMRFEVYGVARGSAHAKELNDLGTPVLLASTQVTQSTGLFGVELPSLDTRTAFKKIWLKVIFGDGSNSTDDNIFVPGSNGFRVYGYPV